MSKWHVSDECIYDEDGNQIIEATEWYMRENLQIICDEHNSNEALKKYINEFFNILPSEDVIKIKNDFNNWINRYIDKKYL